MKIALLYLGKKGGAATYSLELAKELNKTEDILVLISRQAENLSQWKKTNIRIVEISTYKNVLQFLMSSINIFRYLEILRAIREFSPDITHCTMIHPWIPLIFYFNKKSKKVLTIHDPHIRIGEKAYLRNVVQEASIRSSNHIVLLSKVFKRFLLEKGIEENKIDIIPHGLFSYYKELVKPEQKKVEQNKSITFLFFGRITKYKGIHILLDAYEEILKYNQNINLLIVGKGKLGELRNKINSLQNVEVTNRWVDDGEVAALFERADIVVLPYIDASQSGVIPIACMHKKPVIATRIGGLSEQVDDQKSGILIEKESVQELVNAMAELMLNKEKRIQYGEYAYTMALRKWSWFEISNRHIEMYKKLSIKS